MNPATSTALDPKLKEVYDRVMGTSVNASSKATEQTNPIPPTPPANNPSSQGQSHVTATAAQPSPQAPQTITPGSAPIASSHPQAPIPPPRPASMSTAGQTKSAVDYAALAAKYATPPPVPMDSANNNNAPAPPKQAAVTPSTTTYGVVNNGTNDIKKPLKLDAEDKGSMTKKIMLIAGILMFFVIYTFVWVVVFGFELPI